MTPIERKVTALVRGETVFVLVDEFRELHGYFRPDARLVIAAHEGAWLVVLEGAPRRF